MPGFHAPRLEPTIPRYQNYWQFWASPQLARPEALVPVSASELVPVLVLAPELVSEPALVLVLASELASELVSA